MPFIRLIALGLITCLLSEPVCAASREIFLDQAIPPISSWVGRNTIDRKQTGRNQNRFVQAIAGLWRAPTNTPEPFKQLRLESGEILSVYRLNIALLEQHAVELTQLANLLAVLQWTPEKLKAKWRAYPNQHSFMMVNSAGAIVGMSLAYEKNEIDGTITAPEIPKKQRHLYAGPGAIAKEYQSLRLGDQLLICIIDSYQMTLEEGVDLTEIGMVVQATRANQVANAINSSPTRRGMRVIGTKEYEGRAWEDQDHIYYRDMANLVAYVRAVERTSRIRPIRPFKPAKPATFLNRYGFHGHLVAVGQDEVFEAIDRAIELRNAKRIAIDGPPAAGKSSFVDGQVTWSGGKSFQVISKDDFLLSEAERDALMVALVAAFAADPQLFFSQHGLFIDIDRSRFFNRLDQLVAEQANKNFPGTPTLIEGVGLLSAEARTYSDLRIFIDVTDDMALIQRRLERNKQRGKARSPETIQQWSRELIIPVIRAKQRMRNYMEHADFVIINDDVSTPLLYAAAPEAQRPWPVVRYLVYMAVYTLLGFWVGKIPELLYHLPQVVHDARGIISLTHEQVPIFYRLSWTNILHTTNLWGDTPTALMFKQALQLPFVLGFLHFLSRTLIRKIHRWFALGGLTLYGSSLLGSMLYSALYGGEVDIFKWQATEIRSWVASVPDIYGQVGWFLFTLGVVMGLPRILPPLVSLRRGLNVLPASTHSKLDLLRSA